MAKWLKEHLGFKTTKAPPPAPPKPDYRLCLTGTVPGAPGYQQTGCGVGFPSPAQPDIVAAYKLQKERDFEDPYTPGGNISYGPGLNSGGSPDIKYVSPKHRLIKVETMEKSSPAPGGGVAVTPAVAVGSVKSPTSPPSEHDNKEKPNILEDYADPFDAEQTGGTQTSTEKASTENDGYMEPYEAQKMMAEIRSGGRGPKDGPARQLPLYDTPYEPAENGGDSDPEHPRCPRESRLPQDDERPPEEYDQPWEWKKERISKAFAALLCYNCISYEGSVSGTGSGPHGGKDCSSKSLTGTIGDGAGDCLLSVFISILDFYALTRIVQFELIYLPKSSAHRSRMFLHNECHTHLLRFISGCKSFTLQELACVF
uniref:SH2 domain-containing adapter protein D-like isoform X5 n=1 Tax=Gasterosteus aculeatus aculeatus TaxID=481459 RepID=UPI001A98A19D|nr:SH2 domain-containing adapter protein D-like isoform X5 [Gasterosteus aculeatus aculeatus]